MPQICSVCRHPRRLEVEKALIAGTALRAIARQYGPSRAAITRHRTHIAGQISDATKVRELVRKNSLLDDIRIGEDRVETLFQQAQKILAAAVKDDDGRSAAPALRAAVAVLAEARNFMTLRAELAGEFPKGKTSDGLSIQIICPWSGDRDNMPRVTFAGDGAGEIDGLFEIVKLDPR